MSPHQTNWRQGAILPAKDIESFIESSITPLEIGDDAAFIVASQDCDVLNCKEPLIEMVYATKSDMPSDTGLLHGRSVRDLYLPCDDGSCYHLNINSRVWVKEEAKDQLSPISQLPPNLTNRLTGWLSFRYRREAFPDNFNDLLKKAIKNLLSTLSKRNNEQLIAIYLGIEPDGELAEGETYTVETLVIVAEETPQSVIDAYTEIFERFVAKAKKDAGVSFTPYSDEIVTHESEVTIADLRMLKKWHLEDVSSRTKDGFSEDINPA